MSKPDTKENKNQNAFKNKEIEYLNHYIFNFFQSLHVSYSVGFEVFCDSMNIERIIKITSEQMLNCGMTRAIKEVVSN